jgi:hypothetical protein
MCLLYFDWVETYLHLYFVDSILSLAQESPTRSMPVCDGVVVSGYEYSKDLCRMLLLTCSVISLISHYLRLQIIALLSSGFILNVKILLSPLRIHIYLTSFFFE